MKPQNQGRRGRSRGTGERPGTGPDSDPLVALRAALQNRDAAAFAGCFSPGGWIRVPRPDGDLVFQGADEIARAGDELSDMLEELTWTPSQRFLAAGQVVEEAVVRARWADDAGADQIRVSMRAVSALDPAGRVGSLTLWIDWAALDDPLGVESARGAASALVAHARAQDARGLRVIQSGPHTSSLPLMPVRVPPPPPRSNRPPARVLWWRQHRRTVAGSVMALLTVAVLGWAAENVLHSPRNPAANNNTAAGATSAAGVGATAGGPGSGSGSQPSGTASVDAPASIQKSALPVITQEKPSAKPTVQPGTSVTFQSDVLFKTNSTDLSPSALTLLATLAERVQREKIHGTIQINGYTDSRGSDAFNVKLSRDRALAVAEALRVDLAGSDVGLMPQGFGKSHPIGSNSTAAGQRKNRRVTIILPKS